LDAAADLARSLEARGCTVPAPSDHPLHGAQDSRWIAPAHLLRAAATARAAGFFYESLTCVDRLDPHGVVELIYTFNRWDAPARLALRVWAPSGEPVPSMCGIYGIAEWNERETWELYGLRFSGHPNLTWLLLPEDTAFRPLLKSFTAPPPSVYDATLTTSGHDDARDHG